MLWQRLVLAVHSLNLFSRVCSAVKLYSAALAYLQASESIAVDSYGCASFHVERASVCHYASRLRAAFFWAPLQLGTLSFSAS